MKPGAKLAIVLFNLGGPDGPESVRPFLRNLFRDPAIIAAPGLVRESLAWLISTLREKSAKSNYAKMGGGSPLLAETEAQAAALLTQVKSRYPDQVVRVFTAMRYWHPFVEEAAEEVRAWGADEVVLLPLYPQYSLTTTGSSLTAWTAAGGASARSICCYPTEKSFVAAHADLVRKTWEEAGKPSRARLLFSAHGLPEKTVALGDPYPSQIEQTAAAVAEQLPELSDWQVCYQSRVGPMKWIGPSTEDAIAGAATDNREIILTPIAFVSEHIETLVELDEEYRDLALELGVSGYHRVPALGCHPGYITCLSDLVTQALGEVDPVCPARGTKVCATGLSRCPRQTGEREN
jgi:ferrochelatase